MIEESDLLRFVEGECSPAEAAAIQAWIAAAQGAPRWPATGGSHASAARTSDGSAPATSLENGDGVARADRRGGRAPGRRRRPLVAPFAARTATRVRDRARAAGGAHVA